jgi:tetratricopeptide (TPR) repeat protein
MHPPSHKHRQASAERAYLFRHALVRDAAYELQPPAERARLHWHAYETLRLEPNSDDRWSVELADHVALAPADTPGIAKLIADVHLQGIRWARAEYMIPAVERLAKRLAADERVAWETRIQAQLALTESQLEFRGVQTAADSVAQLGQVVGNGTPIQRMRWRRLHCRLLCRNGKLAEALEALEGLTEEFDAVPDPMEAADTVMLRGVIHDDAGDMDQAVRAYQQAAQRFANMGNARGKGVAIGNLGNVYRRLGNYAEAEAAYTESLRLAEESGNRSGRAALLANMAFFLVERARPLEGQELAAKALKEARQIGRRTVEAFALGVLGSVSSTRGQHVQAVGYYEEAIQISRDISDQRREGVLRNNMADALLQSGRKAEAKLQLQEALRLHQRMNNPRSEGITRLALGSFALNAGEPAEAERELHEAQALLEATSASQHMSEVYRHLARLAAIKGEHTAAVELAARSLRAELGPAPKELINDLASLGVPIEMLRHLQA